MRAPIAFREGRLGFLSGTGCSLSEFSPSLLYQLDQRGKSAPRPKDDERPANGDPPQTAGEVTADSHGQVDCLKRVDKEQLPVVAARDPIPTPKRPFYRFGGWPPSQYVDFVAVLIGTHKLGDALVIIADPVKAGKRQELLSGGRAMAREPAQVNGSCDLR